MGLLDSVKARLGPAKGKVSDLAQQHGGRIQHGLDRAAKAVDERTKGKYSDRIRTGADKAKGAVDRLAHKDGTGADTGGGTPGSTPPTPGTTPPAGPPPTS
ncbi:collagen triple helix repeat-containing protein [Streptomyces cyaneogriseus subsp. noncyanogenus]|uniref:Collagen triple helix repeat-containing protein n=1 Tax=Streptomyces cyaneogriseus subsp. noncyanogenus TaxID=477245 RepID=A0A0C5G654_9ACTN|nr:antitoxin [Streptomyces cyaneogriseus]AJP04165.1 collagen triple helix repeat-containing protein [Streptomyces cyaneogriseus subsp. noncyanogenus]